MRWSDNQTLLSFEVVIGDFDAANSEPKSDVGLGLTSIHPSAWAWE